MKNKKNINKKIIIDANFPSETRVALIDKYGNIEHIEYESTERRQTQGNIYLAKVTRVEPSLQAAFVDYGQDKSGFLSFSEIHSDYFHTFATDKSINNPFNEIKPPEIKSESSYDKNTEISVNSIMDTDDLDLNTIEKMLDNKIEPDFDIEADELDIGEEKKTTTNNIKNQDYKIHEVIKKGQILLIQVIKEERGNKGAVVTTYISLAGRYCVLMPNKVLHNGVSKKISNITERKRLKDIINNLNEDHSNNSSSLIARTAAIGRGDIEIRRDYDYLVRLWNKIREITLKSQAPCFIHAEDNIILKAVRNIFDTRVKEIIIQGTSAYSKCIKFMREILPSEVKTVKEYKGKIPIFTKYAIEDQITKLYQSNVTLPSGGYIVINPTEALISIDINSGKSTSERNVEETALKTNLEASREIAKQVKLRDLSGLLVIDFIDMYEIRHRKIIERSLKEFLKHDKARIHTAQMSNFGLLEMSRQRLRPSFLEMHSSMCKHCGGKGIVRIEDSNAMLILRTIENEIDDTVDILNVFAHTDSIITLLNTKRNEILFLEKKYSIKLQFHIDHNATSDSFSIEKIKLQNKNLKNEDKISQPALQNIDEIYISPDTKLLDKDTNIVSDNNVQNNNNTKRKRKRTSVNIKKTNSTTTNNKETEQLQNSTSNVKNINNNKTTQYTENDSLNEKNTITTITEQGDKEPKRKKRIIRKS